jgi:hypothetical protein
VRTLDLGAVYAIPDTDGTLVALQVVVAGASAVGPYTSHKPFYISSETVLPVE